MTISVVVATFNRAGLLRDCLEQLRIQSYEPGDEVIIVDNASTDETPALLANAAATFPVPLRSVRETTPGKTPALNAGLTVARGDVLALTDDDIMVGPEWIATIRRLFGEPGLALAGGRVDPRWERPAPHWLVFEQGGRYGRMSSPLALQHYGERQPLGSRTAVGANLVVRREVLQAVGGFAPHLGRIRGTLMCGEDHEFCQRVVGAGYLALYDPSLAVRHWIPAARTRLLYYGRWFFWSGVTNATIETAPVGGPSFLGSPRYVWGQLARGPLRAAGCLLRGRSADAAAAAMDGMFAAGYVWTRLKRGNQGGSFGRQEIAARHQQAPQLPAPAQSPAIPAPGVAGKLFANKANGSTATRRPTVDPLFSKE